MHRGILRRLAPWLALALAAAAAPAIGQETPAERPRIYKWVDENGIAHYTTDRSRIPSGLRNRAEALGASPALEPRVVAPSAPRDEYDAWAVRNRSSRTEDIWDEGAATGSPDYEPPPSPEEIAAIASERQDIDRRIAELEGVIAEDEDALKAMVSEPGVDPVDRGDDPEFRSIALRLPKRLAELRALRDQRAALVPEQDL